MSLLEGNLQLFMASDITGPTKQTKFLDLVSRKSRSCFCTFKDDITLAIALLNKNSFDSLFYLFQYLHNLSCSIFKTTALNCIQANFLTLHYLNLNTYLSSVFEYKYHKHSTKELTSCLHFCFQYTRMNLTGMNLNHLYKHQNETELNKCESFLSF